ncbi:hypothetical protein [Ancylobacter mangrovi]|uniref:Uncharacterized protein n=1 Tax=Ancylobacter mangrovi TaxID=2972472 RepID=A0A9X2T2A6_9HYPH|nr:hypothetical protein [Ancylobacter mangrovi]MCS0493611.1 hypothetical protein [Ancylobacter mangrovi]MCS0501771.1 hypothetical protein [Ancylobacter mangrovi]
MLKTIAISAVAAVMGFTALFVGAASATGYFTPKPKVATVEIPAQPVAGDCVIQTRWMSDAGRMVQVERPVCY